MLTIALTVATLMSATQVSPVALADTTLRDAASRTSVAVMTPASPTAADYLESARRALSNGQFDVARREFVIAAALERDAGRLPTEAVFGLVNALYVRSFNREAAVTLDKFADEASAAGDYNVEARALVDAIWLNLDARQKNQARNGAIRLKQLIQDRVLSDASLKLIRSRYR